MFIPRVTVVAMLLLGLVGSPGWAQERQLSGRVLAESGDPIAGAAVTIAGASRGTLTDQDGAFAIRIGAGEVTLVVQSIGYKMRELRVAPDQTSLVVRLQTDVLALDEVVVTGYATTVARRNLANAVATVRAEDLDRAPAESIEKSLQGKVPGAIIQTNSGAPGGGVQVRLRGVSTINGDADPLYVVDGIIVSNAAIPSNANEVTRAAGGSNPSLDQDVVVNRVVDINPADIESVEILKGASAAAIYGSKAANGVIVITTKKGRPGAPRFNVSQRLGSFDLSRKVGFRQFETVDEAVGAFGEGARSYFDANGRPKQVFDYEEILAGRNDLSYETSASVSGGDDDTRYFASGVWKNDEGIITNTGFQKQGGRVNLSQRLGSRFDVTVHSNVLHTVAERGLTNNDNSGTSYWMVFPFTPNFVDLRPDGEGIFPDNPFEKSNPLQTAALTDNVEEVWRVISAVNASFEAYNRGPHNLRLVALGGVDYFNQKNDLYFPPELQFEQNDGLPGTSLLSHSDNRNVNMAWNAIYSYAPEHGRFRSTTSAGYQFEDRDLRISRLIGKNLPPGQRNVDLAANRDVRAFRQRVKDVGIYLQEELLTFDERLMLTAGVRADRSSANGDPEQVFVYPKASASYRIPGLTDALDELKLRAAWGQSGNQPLFGQKFTPLRATENIEGLPGLVVVGILGDKEIEPERTSEIEGGIDATLFGGNARLEFTVFEKNVDDLLLQRELAPSTGFTLQAFNGAQMRVRGIELGLEATPIRNDRLSWFSQVSFYADRSEITHLPVPPFRTGGFGTALGAYEIREGRSATQIVANVIENGESVVRPVGDGAPDFKMAFINDFTVGRLSLHSLWDWQQGGKVINLTKLLFDFGQNTADYDADPQYVDRIGPIEINDTLTLGERRIRGFGLETRPYIEDATFLKLREVGVEYDVPAELVSRLGAGMRTVRLGLAGRNLLSFQKYSGMDPEVSNFGNQAIARNIDVAPFPPSRSFWFTVNVGF